MYAGYVRFVRIQCLGGDPARLQFDRLTREQTARLEEPIRHLRREWARFQMMRDVGGTGRSIHQMAGNALHHVDVDGDCFLTHRGPPGRRVWDLHPGDALAEGQYRTGFGGRTGNRQLGIEVDGYGRPLAYYFRHGGRLAPLNVEFSTFGGQGGDAVGISAKRVQHIRDLSGEVTAVRGWPRSTAVIEDIARLDDWYSALVRGAITRAAIGLALKRLGRRLGRRGQCSARPTTWAPRRPMPRAPPPASASPRYAEFARNAGTVMEMDPGWEVHEHPVAGPVRAGSGWRSGMLERRVCAALRTSPATLLGDYKALSFSGGQLAHLQEKPGDRRPADDALEPVLRADLQGLVRGAGGSSWWRCSRLCMPGGHGRADVSAFPPAKVPGDRPGEEHKADSRTLGSAGLITYAEARESLGHRRRGRGCYDCRVEGRPREARPAGDPDRGRRRRAPGRQGRERRRRRRTRTREDD